MLKVFYGSDRERALRAATRFLGGPGYETIEGSELRPDDLPNIFLGTSLFAPGERRILLRDALASPAGDALATYATTPYRVALLELKVDRRLTAWKSLSAAVDCEAFEAAEPNSQRMFDIYRLAQRDGPAAVRALREIRDDLEPKSFIGVLAAQAFRNYSNHPGPREKRALKELAHLDSLLSSAPKPSPDHPWLLIESFLIRLSSL